MADFATRLKELRKDRKLRQIDLAKEMKVAQTTIANYEQHSRFPDEETLRNVANYFDVSLDYLLGRSDINLRESKASQFHVVETPDKARLSPLARDYIDLLLVGEKEKAYSEVVDAAKNGMPVQEIYQEVFSPALKIVGRLWETNEIDVAKEHYFSEATKLLMGRLYPFLKRPKEIRGVVVSVAVNGEYHHIGLRMITDILEEQGWKCYYIGVNTPTASLVQEIEGRNADVLAISATMPFNVDSVADMILHIRSASQRKNLKIITGGQAFNLDSDLWKRIGADGYAADLDETVLLMDSFLPR